MGTWGVGPFDNDTAGDMVAKLSRMIDRVVNAPPTARGNGQARALYEEARVAARFVAVAHGTDILGGPSLAPVVQMLCRMRSDDDWLANYRNPREIVGALDDEIRDVLLKIATCKGCGRSLSRESKKELRALADAAVLRKVPKSSMPPRRVSPAWRRLGKVKAEVKARKLRSGKVPA